MQSLCIRYATRRRRRHADVADRQTSLIGRRRRHADVADTQSSCKVGAQICSHYVSDTQSLYLVHRYADVADTQTSQTRSGRVRCESQRRSWTTLQVQQS